MSDVQAVLGIDLDELEWQDLSLCSGMPINLFFDDYESDANVATVVDEVCLSCPVMAQCLDAGIQNNEWGCWGGIYLTSGKPDKNRNSHKTADIWEQIRGKISAESLH